MQEYSRGSKRLAISIASDSLALSDATQELKNRVFARSNLSSVTAKRDTWAAVAQAAGFADPFSPVPDMLYAVAAALWKAGYRSLDSYIAVAKQEIILQHGSIPDVFALHIRRVIRAAARGRGPPKQACELPFLKLEEFALREEPLSPAGPCFPGRVAVIASWWMLREIELMNLSLDCVSFDDTNAHIMLPVSKVDPTGKGTSRSLCCTCSSTSANLCPFHVLKAQTSWALSLPGSSASSPLCPCPAGVPPTTKEVVLTILAMAQHFGLNLHTRSGAPRFTGHSFRVTGAMLLASSGIDIWRIQLHGRWGSDTVLQYVRLAPLAKSLALEVSLGKDLSDVQTALLQAKATLSSLTPQASAIPLEDVLDTALGPSAKPAAFLGKPTVDQILGNSSVKGWHRVPKQNEILVANVGPPNYDGKLHSMRPPLCVIGTLPTLSNWEHACSKTWCSWKFLEVGSRAELHSWDNAVDKHGEAPLCGRCFGKQAVAASSSSASSDTE